MWMACGRFSDASELYDRTEELAKVALDRANEAHQEALDLYREAQSPVPSIDVAKLSQDAQDIKEEVGKRICLGILTFYQQCRSSKDESHVHNSCTPVHNTSLNHMYV